MNASTPRWLMPVPAGNAAQAELPPGPFDCTKK